MSWGLQHGCTGPDTRGRVHVLETEIAGVEAVISGDLGNLRVSVFGENDINALHESMLVHNNGNSQAYEKLNIH